mgnify:CR=1 FL=1
MEWIWNNFVGWIFSLCGAAFDTMSTEITGFFNLSTYQFFALFPDIYGLYHSFVVIGIGFAVIILLVRLMSNFFVGITEEYENPVHLAIRFIITVILIANAGTVLTWEIRLMQTPYDLVMADLDSDYYNDLFAEETETATIVSAGATFTPQQLAAIKRENIGDERVVIEVDDTGKHETVTITRAVNVWKVNEELAEQIKVSTAMPENPDHPFASVIVSSVVAIGATTAFRMINGGIITNTTILKTRL